MAARALRIPALERGAVRDQHARPFFRAIHSHTPAAPARTSSTKASPPAPAGVNCGPVATAAAPPPAETVGAALVLPAPLAEPLAEPLAAALAAPLAAPLGAVEGVAERVPVGEGEGEGVSVLEGDAPAEGV